MENYLYVENKEMFVIFFILSRLNNSFLDAPVSYATQVLMYFRLHDY